MPKTVSGFRACALLVLGTLSCAFAQATVLDFEAVSPNLYDNGESFTQGAYTFVVGGSFGAVDTAAGCFIATCPSNNATQFYQGYNDSHVTLRRTDGGSFSLLGFDAAFIAPVPIPADLLTGRIEFTATGSNGSFHGGSDFASSVADGSVPFETYSLAALAGLTSLKSVDFYACSFNDAGNCVNPIDNLAQFALDNVSVNVAPVPEPGTVALMAMGLAFVGWRHRRAGKSA